MNYYCHNCNNETLYLTEVTDPDSAHFNEQCCPYCGSTNVNKIDLDEAYIKQFGAEMEQLKSAEPTIIALPPLAAFAIVTHIQLASRHPHADTAITKMAIDTARQLQQLFDPNSITGKVLETGWDPKHDRSVNQ